MRKVDIISKVVGRSGAEASPSSAIMPNMSGYATKTELNTLRDEFKDFLEGADADVIINKWQDLVEFLKGISEDFDLLSMLGLKADKSELSNYVTIATTQTITGEKNFTGGLKVNGSPIVYDATNKYWKLEGDLLVTGGVTMYASDSSFTPSTIMNGVVVDNVTILKDTETGALMINPELVLGGGGGEVSTVAWGNVLGKPSWITDTKPIYSYSEISGTPTLLSSFNNDIGFVTSDAIPTNLSQLTDDVVSGNYLSLSGGTMTGPITLTSGSSAAFDKTALSFISKTGTEQVRIGTNSSANLGIYSVGNIYLKPNSSFAANGPGVTLSSTEFTYNDYKIWHEGNDGSASGLDADLLDGYHVSLNYSPNTIPVRTSDGVLSERSYGFDFYGASVTNGWYRVYKSNSSTNSGQSSVLVKIGKSYGNSQADNYVFYITITRLIVTITQISGNYSKEPHISKIRVNTETNNTKFSVDVLMNNIDASESLRCTGFGDGVFQKATLVEEVTGYSVEFDIVRGCKSETYDIGNSTYLSGFTGNLEGNASTATQIQTARTIWGQSFDGSGDVSGDLLVGDGHIVLDNNKSLRVRNARGESIEAIRITSGNTFIIGEGIAAKGYSTYLDGSNVRLRYGTSSTTGLMLNSSGNVLIGTTTNSGYRLDVNGDIRSTTNVRTPIATIDGISIYKIQDDVLYIDGNLAVRGGITMYSTDAIDVPSIIDALPIASSSAKGIASFNPNDFSVVDGYVSFTGSSGVDESILDNYAKKSDLNKYLPKTGGEIRYLIYDPYIDYSDTGVPYAGVVNTSTIFNDGAFNMYKSFLGGVYYEPSDDWYHVISVRHRNGYSDGFKYGMYLTVNFSSQDNNLKWNKQENGTYIGERVILDSVNWKDYVTTGNGGISGNVLTVDGSDYRGGYPALRMHISNINWQQFLMRGDGIVELRYGDGGQNGRLGQLVLGTLFFDDQRDDVLYFPGKEYFDNHGNMHIPNADGSWSWNVFNSNSSNVMSVYTNGNMFVAGGITMYSDIRKKTKLQDVELTLQQIADAPLIEHYYNSDTNKTTHVGSIAQYWASMNDWFCKLDNDGFYTMEIQNAALASAISIARELVKYESKTDKKIRLLKQRMKELEDKIEKLENN